MDSVELCFEEAHQLASLIKNKIISPLEATRTFLERIEAVNPLINAYCTVAADQALEKARKLESSIVKGESVGPLAGVPVAVKDVTLTKGIKTTFGSKLYKDYIPENDSLIVGRLKEAGAIIMGKTNTPEFAAGGATYNDLFGATRTPWNVDFNSGGSSGGSASAVAAGLCSLAEGNDLGGSLRIPASFCGIVGLRPSPGRIPVFPNDLYWDNMSVEGPMARSVKDAALMLDAVAGSDRRSPVALMSGERSIFNDLLNINNCKYRIAWSDNLNLTPIDDEVLGLARGSIEIFKSLSCTVTEDCPDFQGLQETATVLRGVRYAALYQEELNRPEFIELVNSNIIENARQGIKLSGSDIARAEKHRSDLWQKMLDFFVNYDLLVTPTVPVKPFLADVTYPTEINGKAMKSYIDWIMLTYAFSVTGLPAISIPCGWTVDGLPVGLQIAGKPGCERDVLTAASCFEQAKPWRDRRPPLGN